MLLSNLWGQGVLMALTGIRREHNSDLDRVVVGYIYPNLFPESSGGNGLAEFNKW